MFCMQRTSFLLTTRQNMEWIYITSFALINLKLKLHFYSFSLLLILLDLERGGVLCEDNAKATDRLQVTRPGL